MQALSQETIQKKYAQTDRAAQTYIQSLHSFLPCLDMANGQHAAYAHNLLESITEVAKTQAILSKLAAPDALAASSQISGQMQSPPRELSLEEEREAKQLAEKHGIYVGRDPAFWIVKHDSMGVVYAFSPEELLEVLHLFDEGQKAA
jgi:hypothetical protein